MRLLINPHGPDGIKGNSMTYYAHTANNSAPWQPLCAHLRNVAALAQRFAAPLGLADEAGLAGLLHDL